MLLCIATASGLADMIGNFRSDRFTDGLGGTIGRLLYGDLLKDTVGVVGAGLLLGTFYIITLAFIFSRDVGAEIEKALAWIHSWRLRRAQYVAERAEQAKKERELKERPAPPRSPPPA